MNDYFNTNNLNSAEVAMIQAKAEEKENRKIEIEKQKKENYDNKVLEVAEETRNIEKENLTISKKIFCIAKITLVVAIASGIISLIALFKN